MTQAPWSALTPRWEVGERVTVPKWVRHSQVPRTCALGGTLADQAWLRALLPHHAPHACPQARHPQQTAPCSSLPPTNPPQDLPESSGLAHGSPELLLSVVSWVA
jgi:hypothetical protein